jgi:aspartate--ammonia ligase
MKRDMFPKGYKPKLDFFDTERGIKLVKDTFERGLLEKLSLVMVSAPRVLTSGTGIQDDLAGTQEPVSFKTKSLETTVEAVQSLAKWKRQALGKYSFRKGIGLCTDMDAIRKDEEIDSIHSIYVDQWDWEKVVEKSERSLGFLKDVVKKIYSAVRETEKEVCREFPLLSQRLPDEIHFVHSEELEEIYPDLTPKEREREAAREYGAVFIIGIGYPLKSGEPHDLRAADYDDWSTETLDGMRGLNGDLIVWHPEREDSLELSSMGIRVDSDAMILQLKLLGQEDRKDCEFHRLVIGDKLPLTIGGGIGQSRLCMLLLQKAHIGEVQSSVWTKEMEEAFEKIGVDLL